jgi:4-amino-4-deoxy-L-arabinose transferase-like glycosyltransferase
VVLLTLFALTIAQHLFRLGRSYDLFIDESFYTQVGRSVANGHMPYATGIKFFLHPPGFFLVEAVWIHIFGVSGNLFQQVFSMRQLVSLFAAGTVVCVVLIVSRTVNRTAALVAGVVLMMNAFFDRDTSIVILEPATVFWALAGWVVLAYLPAKGSRWRTPSIIAAGLLFGFAVLTKEFGVFITIVPLVLMLAFRCVLKPMEAVAGIALSILPYACWIPIVIETGNWSTFWAQTLTGFRRAAGTDQISGFNRAGAPSFLGTILRDLGYLWTAYAILGLGSLAILYVVWKAKTPTIRMMGLFGMGALPLCVYCVLFGTNEEQFYNFLLSPALICLVIVVWQEWHRAHWIPRALLVFLATAVVISDWANYALVHVHQDDGTYLVDQWMAAYAPPHTKVIVTNPVQREIFLRYTMVDDRPGLQLSKVPNAAYLVVFYRQVDEYYAFVDPQTVARQVRGLIPVFSFTDNSNGRMLIYAIL